MWDLGDNLELKQAAIEEEVSQKILEKLLCVTYFAEAYEETMDPDRYAKLAPTVFTTQQFSQATKKMVGFVRDRMATVCVK